MNCFFFECTDKKIHAYTVMNSIVFCLINAITLVSSRILLERVEKYSGHANYPA
jgi:hypothetical protein